MHTISLLTTALALTSHTCWASALPTELETRQSPSPTWQDSCGNPAPNTFRAFNIGNCEAQLTFNRGKNIGVMWNFDAIYPDGSRVNHDPFRDFNNIAVSDPFYTIGYGTNYITNRTQSQAFTSVHEFSNVCRNGVAPSGWVFYTSSANSACTSSSYRFTTGRITTTTGTRPAKTNFSGRSINAAGEIEITWTGADGAQSYNAFIRIPTNRYEGGNGYFTTDRGARLGSSARSARFPGVTASRNQEEPRKVYVNVMNAQGVWSFTPGTVPVDVFI